MEKKQIRLPFKAYGDYILIECFVNDYIKGYYLVDFKLEKVILNKAYFSLIFKENERNTVFIDKLNCGWFKLEYVYIEIDDLSQYEQGSFPIFGILGNDFFRGFRIAEIEKSERILVLEPKTNIDGRGCH